MALDLGISSLKAMVIHSNREAYFLSAHSDCSFQALKEGTLCSFIYKVARKARIEFRYVWYGAWTNMVDKCNTFVILDSAFDEGMPKFIKRRNNNAKVVLMFMNPIQSDSSEAMIKSFEGDCIASYYLNDCKKYHLSYLGYFYSDKFSREFLCEKGTEVVFLGRNKGRIGELSRLACSLDREGISHRFMVFDEKSVSSAYGVQVLDEYLPYRKYCEIIASSAAILDVSQEGVDALNLRIMEALFFGKKLVTTNQQIGQYGFYRPENILIISDLETCASEIAAFLQEPFVPYPDWILDWFDFDSAMSRFAQIKPGQIMTLPQKDTNELN